MMKPAAVLVWAALLGGASAQEPAWVQPAADEATGQICHLVYYHHGHARPEDLSGTQCSAWSDNACCSADTAAVFQYDVADADTGLYDGHGMGISQCGIPSQACQKWFIAENCMYECDVNAGRYRHAPGDEACDDSNEATNTWQMSGFPLKVLGLPPLPPAPHAPRRPRHARAPRFPCLATWFDRLTHIYNSSGWPFVPEIIPVEPEPVIRAEESFLLLCTCA